MKLLLQVVWPLALMLGGLWAFRLWRAGMSRRYMWLFLYLVWVVIQGSVSLVLYYSAVRVGGRSAYTIWWPMSQPVIWLLTFAVIFEIFDRLIEGYRGLQKLGRLVVYGTLGFVGAVVILSMVADAFTFADLDRWKSFWLKQELSISLFMAGSLFLLFLFQKLFHSIANPNVRLVFVLFGLYHALESGLMVLRTYIGPGFRDVRDLAGMTAYAACMLVGWLYFSPHGETRPTVSAAAGELAGVAARRMRSFNDQLETILRA